VLDDVGSGHVIDFGWTAEKVELPQIEVLAILTGFPDYPSV
jgi:hypothetical protein